VDLVSIEHATSYLQIQHCTTGPLQILGMQCCNANKRHYLAKTDTTHYCNITIFFTNLRHTQRAVSKSFCHTGPSQIDGKSQNVAVSRKAHY